MSRFYGPGKQPIKPGYQPREGSATNRPDSALVPSSLAPCTFIRFVLKTGDAFELSESSLEDVVGIWADRICKTVCGCREDGSKVVIPTDNIAYMEEVR